MIKRNTIIPNSIGDGSEDQLVDKDRTFFCSELVAKCYKVCGIMQPTELSSTNFFPSDFGSDKNKLQLVDGAKL